MKALYRNMNEQIDPPGDLKAKVFAEIDTPKTKKRLNLRPLGAVAAILAVILLATPVMAAYVPPIEDLMYMVAPNIAARFSPVQESDEANGIRMEVVATSIHGATAEIYLGFTDLEGKGRIAEGAYPMDTWFPMKSFLFGVHGGGMGGGSSSMQYDPDSGSFYTLVDQTYHFYSEWKKRYLTVKELCGEKLTLTVSALQRTVDKGNVTLPVTLRNQETMTIVRDEDGRLTVGNDMGMHFTQFGLGSSHGDTWMQEESYQVMTPGEEIQNITEELAVTGMAYLNGFLHAQIRKETADENAVPGYELFFEDNRGNQVTADRNVSFDIDQNGQRVEYTEFYFDIPEEELENFTLICKLVEHQTINGPWRVTFPLIESDYVGERDDGVPFVTEETVFPDVAHGEVKID